MAGPTCERPRISVERALALIERRVGRLGAERVPVTRCAGRVSAQEARARAAVPHFARAMMDGYAVVAESTAGASEREPRPVALIGEIRAGGAWTGPALASGQAVRIATGAPMPDGADAVLMVELARPCEAGAVLATAAVAAGKHVGAIGEDIAAGAAVLHEGRRIRPQDAGVLASAGVGEVLVVRKARVAIVVTGDELLPPGAMPVGARIVDSNSVVLSALCERDGALPEVSRIADGQEALAAAIRDSIDGGADAILVCGGSSVGPNDHAPAVLAALGELAFQGVAMRPGSPAGFGLARHKPVFLLPGNPVSCLCAYEFFAGPAIRVQGGLPRDWPHRRLRAPLAAPIESQLGRTDYARVRLDERGRVVPLMIAGASLLSSTTAAAGAVIVPAERAGYELGEDVEVLLYE